MASGDPHERASGENKVKLPEMSERSVDPVREDTVKSTVLGVSLIEVPPHVVWLSRRGNPLTGTPFPPPTL